MHKTDRPLTEPSTTKQRVVILLSTYNGEKYLVEQLESLLHQTHQELMIYIRDDGSTDETLKIIENFVNNYQDIIVPIHDGRGNLGAANSFLALLNSVDKYNYIMFCDQDDVWLPEKVKIFLAHIQTIESQQPSESPILIFGDMVVTNESLTQVSKSFWNYQKIQISNSTDWRKMAVSNCVTGCSTILNIMAIRLLIKFGYSMVLHDLLAGVLVAKYGIVEPLYEPTMYYRQHHDNVEGAKNFGIVYILTRIRSFIFKGMPKYFAFCREIDLPLPLALWLKITTTVHRLLQ